jgi:hypothetical protein
MATPKLLVPGQDDKIYSADDGNADWGTDVFGQNNAGLPQEGFGAKARYTVDGQKAEASTNSLNNTGVYAWAEVWRTVKIDGDPSGHTLEMRFAGPYDAQILCGPGASSRIILSMFIRDAADRDYMVREAIVDVALDGFRQLDNLLGSEDTGFKWEEHQDISQQTNNRISVGDQFLSAQSTYHIGVRTYVHSSASPNVAASDVYSISGESLDFKGQLSYNSIEFNW